MSGVNVQNAGEVVELFHEAASANRGAECRQGSIDVIRAPGTLIATGDLHDNPFHLKRLEGVARIGDALDATSPGEGPHITFHEVIHSDRLLNGLDLSYRALARIAELKLDAPERVHTLLANHELSQIVGAGIVKDGVKCVDAFNDGLGYVFGSEWERVAEAIAVFIRAMPIALRCVTPAGDILCAHSLPDVGSMGRFDVSILARDLTDHDYGPRQGSAHLMVWGRGYDAEQLEDLVERWGVNLFILGHEKAENGYLIVPPCAVVLNSDHERGVYLPIDLADPPSLGQIPGLVRPLGGAMGNGLWAVGGEEGR